MTNTHSAVTAIALFLVLALTGMSGSTAGAAKRIRLNEAPGLVQSPAHSQGYGLAVAGSDLYVSWLVRQSFGLHVQLSRIDLEDFTIQETIQLSQGKGATSKGGRTHPDVMEYQGNIYVSWLDRGQRQRKPWHSVNLLSLEDHRKGGKPQVFEFGKFMGGPRLVKTSQGLFLLGFSQNLSERSWRLRLYKKSDQGWVAIEQLNQDLYKGRDPYLIDDPEGLSLFWVWGAEVFRARSSQGEQWSNPQSVVQQSGRIDSLQVISDGERIDLAWVEQGWEQAEAWVRHFDGSAWSNSHKVAQLNGKNAAISLCRDKKSGQRVIAYSYTGLDGAGKVIGVASEREDWAVRTLTASEPRFAGSAAPLIYEGSEGLYVAWSFHPRATQMPRAESLFMAALAGANIGKVRPRAIGRQDLQSVNSAPKLWQFRDEIYVSYFSSQVILGGAVLPRGDLYLEKVELLREARGE